MQFCKIWIFPHVKEYYLRKWIDGVAVGLPSVTANNTIEVTRSGSYVTAVNSKCNIRVQFDGVHLVDMKVSKDHFGGNLTGSCHIASTSCYFYCVICCHGWKANCNSINLKYTCVLYLYNKNDCLPYTIIQGLCNFVKYG
jgi:hypothetical protein